MTEQTSYDPFERVLRKFGPPEGSGPVPYEEAERYRGRVPDRLIEFWVRHGRGSWRNGLFWLCDPEQLMPFVHDLFDGDPEFDPNVMVPYFRDAFGDITVWHPELKVVDVSVHLGGVGNTDITKKPRPGKIPFTDDIAVASGVASAVSNFHGWADADTGEPVFEAVYERLGPIEADEAYVMSPHYRMGGFGRAEDFSIGGLTEYLGFLTQIGTFKRETYIDPKDGGRGAFGQVEYGRVIGSPE